MVFTPLSESDLEVFMSWLQRPHIKPRWPSPDTKEGLREEYLPADMSGAARPFIVHVDGTPTAYIQYYVVSEGSEDWWPDKPPAGAVGIDLFLADSQQMGQGLGTAIVAAFVRKLFDDPAISQVRVDPRPDNTAALRCFEKAGFRGNRSFTSPDGPAVLMTFDRLPEDGC